MSKPNANKPNAKSAAQPVLEDTQPTTKSKGEWPFPTETDPKNEHFDEDALAPGVRVTDDKTDDPLTRPNAEFGTYELKGQDKGADKDSGKKADNAGKVGKAGKADKG